MAKLYATIENSKGKTVSLSDNETLTATVCDGNMKAYSVIIEWTSIGDPEHLHCTKCDWRGDETEADGDDCDICPKCGIQKYKALETIHAEYGAIVTTREWRNRQQTNDKKIGCSRCKQQTPHKNATDCRYYGIGIGGNEI